MALMLADGKALVMEVVPAALLAFSRQAMRARLSAGLYACVCARCAGTSLTQMCPFPLVVARKPVFTFDFDRFRDATPALLAKLQGAASTRAVVVTTPRAVKSFCLKFVEIMHTLDRASSSMAETDNWQREAAGGAWRLGLGLGSGLGNVFHFGGQRSTGALDEPTKANLRTQAELCTQILQVRSGPLMLSVA